MTERSPAATLTAAATKLRELIERAVHENRTTWTTGHTLDSKSPGVVDDPEKPSVLIETYAARLEAVNQYIAAMDPGVGLAIADWLDETATEVSAAEGTEYQLHPKGGVFTSWEAALAVARRILGEQP